MVTHFRVPEDIGLPEADDLEKAVVVAQSALTMSTKATKRPT
jgi:hypothetical protein